MTFVFILASGSPRRREILTEMGITFTVMKPDIDETQHPSESPFAYVKRLSIEKAHAIADRMEKSQEAFILGADTVVILAADTMGEADGVIIGKPLDALEAETMLKQLRNRAHIVCTAISLLTLKKGERTLQTELTQTTVTMRDYSDEEIKAYIATGDPFDKAGSYAIQHEAFHPVAHIDGSYSNVVGLPIETLQKMLDRLSV